MEFRWIFIFCLFSGKARIDKNVNFDVSKLVEKGVNEFLEDLGKQKTIKIRMKTMKGFFFNLNLQI